MHSSLDNPPLEDELGDVLEKAARHSQITTEQLAVESRVDLAKIQDALDYRSELTQTEIGRLAHALDLNEVGLNALAQGAYPRAELGSLPFSVHPLRMPFGVGVANAYVVSTGGDTALLFDTGASHAELHRAWPKQIEEVEAVFVTHYEAEHIGGLDVVMNETGLDSFYGPSSGRWPRGHGLGEKETVAYEKISVTAFSTPGHAAEHNCYLIQSTVQPKASSLLISGDLIFAGSLGGGYFCCQRLLTHSRRILDLLPNETIIAPGHGPLTTAANERRFNPFLAR